jgi:hypothetical protein
MLLSAPEKIRRTEWIPLMMLFSVASLALPLVVEQGSPA